MNTNATKAAARGTIISILLRLLSFLLSQLTVRFVSASTLGRASIPLELLLGSALFVGREGFRLGLTKETSAADEISKTSGNGNDGAIHGVEEREQRIINVSWLSVPTGAILSIFALIFHLYSCQNQSTEYEWEKLDYKIAGMLYCLASFVESLSEPLVIACLQRLDVGTKAKAEGIALLAKGLSCFGTLYLTSRYQTLVHMTMQFLGVEMTDGAMFAVTAFGVSQLVYASVFTFCMYRKIAASSERIRWPKRIKSTIQNPYRNEHNNRQQSGFCRSFDLQTLYLVFIFTLQGLFKHVLTEADKIVLSALVGSYDQGVYALASSYGGLAARLLLQPLEENARLLFSRQGALIARNQSSEAEKDKKDDIEHDDLTSVQYLENTYCLLLRGVLYVGLVFATIATNYTSLLLRILAGNRWGSNSETSEALSAFCVYTAFLALNGITEAFVYGVARSGKDVGQLGLAHALIGGLFAIISPELVRNNGAVGLVAANCICMGFRSAYSLYFASRYFVRIGGQQNATFYGFKVLMKTIPHPLILGLFAASFVISKESMKQNYEMPIAEGVDWLIPAFKHVFVGLSCVLVIIAMFLYMEDDIRAALFNFAGKRSSPQIKTAGKQSFTDWYMLQMEHHEMLTKCITAGILGIVGDIIAQGIERYLDRGVVTTSDVLLLFSTLNKQRTLAMFCDGLFTGPLLHYIFEFYDTLLPLPDEDLSNSTTKKNSLKKVCLTVSHVLIDNIIMAWLYVSLTMCTTAIFEGHYETIPYELENDLFSAVKASYKSSVGLAPMQLMSFLYLPKKLKVLAVNIQDIVWVAVISYATHVNRIQ